MDPGAHRRGQRNSLNVAALRGRRLRADDLVEQRRVVLGELALVEALFAERDVNVCAAVGAVLELAGLRLLHGLAHVHRDGAGLRVRHLPARAEDAAELADHAHLVRGRDRHVEVVEPLVELLVREALQHPDRLDRRVEALAVDLGAGRPVILAVLTHRSVSTPIERAVPATTFIASSTSRAFKSGIFVSAIWRTWSRVRRPTFSRFGSPEPFSSRSASLIRTAAGGVFVMKSNERSSKTVISTGMMRPFWSAVWALN